MESELRAGTSEGKPDQGYTVLEPLLMWSVLSGRVPVLGYHSLAPHRQTPEYDVCWLVRGLWDI